MGRKILRNVVGHDRRFGPFAALTSGRPENADNLERASAASEQALLLAELDDDGLSVGALHALECALILAQTLGWLDLRQKHRQPAFRASSLTDRRLGRVEVLGL